MLVPGHFRYLDRGIAFQQPYRLGINATDGIDLPGHQRVDACPGIGDRDRLHRVKPDFLVRIWIAAEQDAHARIEPLIAVSTGANPVAN